MCGSNFGLPTLITNDHVWECVLSCIFAVGILYFYIYYVCMAFFAFFFFAVSLLMADASTVLELMLRVYVV